ncbi:hypothetical protein NAEGRDRAFT_78955 [Naegleria gruberi]|uniref:Uncharacterized protein n=1 Tax=Naegleria gruberi TaxID=5762 RepID=D2V813_NAEGR|nr:uncharacterized protein NAEGRDRAFT_78955 [Naegleria gruberi]EFC47099.1 hypothetical protein NAEGRDRAFT_78955 [Naegleria gruberi]|eukprot:XP_002679843.1 hypothetical protein NAEGRDRAFT_78955 [Naegleria gruberi strain NEG-M]
MSNNHNTCQQCHLQSDAIANNINHDSIVPKNEKQLLSSSTSTTCSNHLNQLSSSEEEEVLASSLSSCKGLSMKAFSSSITNTGDDDRTGEVIGNGSTTVTAVSVAANNGGGGEDTSPLMRTFSNMSSLRPSSTSNNFKQQLIRSSPSSNNNSNNSTNLNNHSSSTISKNQENSLFDLLDDIPSITTTQGVSNNISNNISNEVVGSELSSLDRTTSVPSSIMIQLLSISDSVTSTPQSPSIDPNTGLQRRKRKKYFKTTEDYMNLEKTIYRECSDNKFIISHKKRSNRLSETTFEHSEKSTNIDVDNSNNSQSSTLSKTTITNSNSNVTVSENEEEEEDEATKLERQKGIRTDFIDITEELNYYIKHNFIQELRNRLEQDRKEREESGKVFNISSNYIDKDATNTTLLHKAASLNRFKIISILIDEYRALVEKKDGGGSTPLFYAVANNCIRACVYLLMRGAKVNVKDNFENTPLSVALRKGYLDIAKTLIMFGADVNFKTQKGQTCLHTCCEEGDLSKVEFLLEKGASILRMNREDQHCLYSAAPHPHLIDYLCRYLLSIEEESVFNITSNSSPSPTNSTPNHQTQQQHLTNSKYLEIEEQNKHDKLFVDQFDSATSSSSSLSGSGNLAPKDAFGKPTLSKIVNRLSGAGNTIIHHCANFGYINSLKLLINYMSGTDSIVECLNEKDKKNGDSPLHLATRKGHQDIILLLARAREVDVDAQNDAGDTALHIAVNQQNQEIVTILVAANCSVGIKNNQKVTAKQLAKKLGISLKVEEDKTLKSLKSQSQGLGFFQKMKFKFKKDTSQLSLEEKAKRHTSAFPSYSTSKQTNTRASIVKTTDGKRYSRSSSSTNKLTSQEEIDEMIKNQPFIKWNAKMDFDPEMNEYHKELFYQVNKLYYIWVADQHSIQIQILLSDFLEKTRKFFSKQEQYMQENNIPGAAGHKQDHDLFISKLEGNLMKLNTLDFTMNEDLFAEISTMLINHLFKHDMPLSVIMKKKANK